MFPMRATQRWHDNVCKGLAMTKRQAKLCARQDCTNTITPRASEVAKGLGNYCSTTCFNRATKSRPWQERLLENIVPLNGSVPTHCPQLGPCSNYLGTIHPTTGYGVLSRDGKSIEVHRLVAELDGWDLTGVEIRHKCDNRACVRLEHLEVGSHADNMRDRDERGRTATGDRSGARTHPEKLRRGESHSRALFTEQDIRDIRAAQGVTQATLARRYGVSEGTIQSVLKGRTWKHVT